MVYRLIVAYRGEAYAGWQRQDNALAVQQVLEEALAGLTGEPVKTTGAGRTDRGVHAEGQAVSFALKGGFPLRGLIHGTNFRLPEDIRVVSADRMPEGFDARGCAASKVYAYRVFEARVLSPLESLFALRVDPGLDWDAIGRATGVLVGRHDFTAFALSGGSHKQPFRTVLSADWDIVGQGRVLRVEGDGFLRGMVRALVGTLLDVGRGRFDDEAFAELLRGAPRAAAGPNAPARGLVLEKVRYPERWQPLSVGPED